MPVEVCARELYQKLVLALELRHYGISSFLVFDKLLTSCIHKLRHIALLDKSASSVMGYRIKHTKKNGGLVFVNDEEGVNDLETDFDTRKSRLDPRILSLVDHYCLWSEYEGNIIERMYPGIKIPSPIKFGSCRNLLLGQSGSRILESYSTACRQLFGDYIFVVDNHVTSRLDKSTYQLPRYSNIDELAQQKLDSELSTRLSRVVQSRDSFVNRLMKLASLNPKYNFIIRPHPQSPLPGIESLSSLKNITITRSLSLEPWLLGARGLLSQGCTSGLQAIASGIPSYRFDFVADENISARLSTVIDDQFDFSNAKQQSNSSSLMEYWDYSVSPSQALSNPLLRFNDVISPSRNFEWLQAASSDPTVRNYLHKAQAHGKYENMDASLTQALFDAYSFSSFSGKSASVMWENGYIPINAI